MDKRGIKTTRKKKTQTERERRDEEGVKYVESCRKRVDEDVASHAAVTEGQIGDLMRDQFPEYVRLKHHNFRWEINAQLAQYSKMTPSYELSVYNEYTGGEGQSKARMDKFEVRVEADVAEEDDQEDEEEMFD